MQGQAKRSRGILSPKIKEELNRKRFIEEEEGTGGDDDTAGARPAGVPGRRQIKFPKGPTAQQESEANTVPPKALPFEERYQRVTTYLEKGLHERIQHLRSSGRVASVTALYNAALRQYINKYYN